MNPELTTFEVIPEAGHRVRDEQPDISIPILEDFLSI